MRRMGVLVTPIRRILVSVFFFFLLMIASGWISGAGAAIPLITDDTGTQGKGKFQVEVLGEYGHDREEGVKTDTEEVSAALTYGILDSVDVVLSVPYAFWEEKTGGVSEKEDGFADLSLEAKWRFFEREGLSFALKPGLTLPTGDEDKGLGAGRTTGYLFLIASKDVSPWAFHLNLAYIRNENKNDERYDLWHASLAAGYELFKGLQLVGDIGIETNPDRSSSIDPAYILGGLIYSPWENFDIGLGVKGGLTETETDVSVRGGVTWRF